MEKGWKPIYNPRLSTQGGCPQQEEGPVDFASSRQSLEKKLPTIKPLLMPHYLYIVDRSLAAWASLDANIAIPPFAIILYFGDTCCVSQVGRKLKDIKKKASPVVDPKKKTQKKRRKEKKEKKDKEKEKEKWKSIAIIEDGIVMPDRNHGRCYMRMLNNHRSEKLQALEKVETIIVRRARGLGIISLF